MGRLQIAEVHPGTLEYSYHPDRGNFPLFTQKHEAEGR